VSRAVRHLVVVVAGDGRAPQGGPPARGGCRGSGRLPGVQGACGVWPPPRRRRLILAVVRQPRVHRQVPCGAMHRVAVLLPIAYAADWRIMHVQREYAAPDYQHVCSSI
jgi:hypothetical protein